jgi:hypothetical protein
VPSWGRGSAEIHPGELIAPWVYNGKFLTGMLILFKMLPFTAGEDDDLEHLAQEQEERHMMMISFKFL